MKLSGQDGAFGDSPLSVYMGELDFRIARTTSHSLPVMTLQPSSRLSLIVKHPEYGISFTLLCCCFCVLVVLSTRYACMSFHMTFCF